MKKALIDSSVVLAACRSLSGGSSFIFMQCRKVKLQGFISQYIAAECKKNASHLTQPQKQRLNFLLLQTSLRLVPEPPPAYVADSLRAINAKDAPILAVGKLLRGDYLITLNTRDFMTPDAREFVKPVRIVTPNGFIKAEKRKGV